MEILSVALSLFLLACAYSAQYRARQCRDELRGLREELKKRS